MKKRYYLFLVTFIFATTDVDAQWISGGTLGYEHIGGASYKITYKEHNDCNSIQSGSARQMIAECVGDSSLNFAFSVIRKSATPNYITPFCCLATPPNNCNCPHSSFGIKDFEYEKTITLPPVGNWKLSLNHSWTRVYTDIDSISEPQITFKAILNIPNASSHNSSPKINSNQFINLCAGQKFHFNIGAIDSDGDSLAYSLSAPYANSWTTRILYKNPYSAQNFVSSSSPIILNSLTGELTFTPDTPMHAAVGFRIEEWRTINDTAVMVGVTREDFKFVVGSNGNFIPKLSGMNFSQGSNFNPNDTIYETTINIDDTVRFTINSIDTDTGNAGMIWMALNSEIAGSNFTIYNNHTDSAYALFEWIPTNNDISLTPKYFTVLVSDSACPYYGQQIYTYSFYIKPSLSIPNLGNDTLLCTNFSDSITLDAGSNYASYLWQDSSIQQTLKINSFDYINNPGPYDFWVRVTDSLGQITADTINIFMEICGSIDSETTEEINVIVKPNPSNGIFSIAVNNKSKSNYYIKIFDISGKKILDKEYYGIIKNSTIEMDLSSFPNGIYLLNIEINGLVSNRKLIKHSIAN